MRFNNHLDVNAEYEHLTKPSEAPTFGFNEKGMPTPTAVTKGELLGELYQSCRDAEEAIKLALAPVTAAMKKLGKNGLTISEIEVQINWNRGVYALEIMSRGVTIKVTL